MPPIFQLQKAVLRDVPKVREALKFADAFLTRFLREHGASVDEGEEENKEEEDLYEVPVKEMRKKRKLN